ncbi:MAG: (Fe-S)-binding protein [Deltaproteobacteria bacterium]|nr:(Fe-S)-binding protein [Deltaproteobacteria bacterium]
MPKRGERLVPEGLLLLRNNILTKGNIFGASSKAKWASGLGLPSQGETIFFAGCGYQFLGGAEATLSAVRALDKRGLAWEKTLGVTKFLNRLGINVGELYGKLTLQARLSGEPLRCAVEVLRRMGMEFGYLSEEEPCCGAPLYYAGFQEEFAARTAETRQTLQNRGIKRVIGIVPSCTYALRELFPRFLKGWGMEVHHFLEVVWEGIKGGMKFRLPQEVRVTYHDPCVLSRYLGLIEEPREILRRIEGVELLEVEHTRGEWSTCCGGGGGFEVIFPEVSHILAVNRVKELLQTGASIIVTSCPGCLIQLKEGVKELKARGVEVMDMAQLLRSALPEG